MQRRPVLTQTAAAARLDLSLPTVMRAMEALERLGIVREISGRRRGKTYVYGDYMEILDVGLAH